MTDLNELKTEIQWCIENGMHGPRTESTLRWALEALETIDEDRKVEEERA